MAGAEHEVLVARDAMTVWSFLLDGANLPGWQADIRSVGLSSGSAGRPIRSIGRAGTASRHDAQPVPSVDGKTHPG